MWDISSWPYLSTAGLYSTLDGGLQAPCARRVAFLRPRVVL